MPIEMDDLGEWQRDGGYTEKACRTRLSTGEHLLQLKLSLNASHGCVMKRVPSPLTTKYIELTHSDQDNSQSSESE